MLFITNTLHNKKPDVVPQTYQPPILKTQTGIWNFR